MTMAGDTRVAVVSGGNRGIGREIARGLVERGFDVVATSRTEAGRADVEAVGARWLPLDVSRRDSVGAFGEAVRGVDVLVNNAGVALDGFDEEVVLQTMAVNFLGAMHLTDTLLPKLRSGGRVVNVSSGMGELSCLGPRLRARFADPDLTREDLVTLVESFERDVESGAHTEHGWPSSAYRVSKAALNALTRIYARELAEDARRIRVNAACPGWVATDMGGPGAPRSPAEGAVTPLWLASEAPGELTGKFFRDRAEISF